MDRIAAGGFGLLTQGIQQQTAAYISARQMTQAGADGVSTFGPERDMVG